MESALNYEKTVNGGFDMLRSFRLFIGCPLFATLTVAMGQEATSRYCYFLSDAGDAKTAAHTI